jgi:integrase/recombinase XerD
MSLGKQAKTLNKKQIDQLLWYVSTLRHAQRNEIIVLLSVRAGLRAKEIAGLKWAMLTDADGKIAGSIHLTDIASKGRSGRIILTNTQLRHKLQDWLQEAAKQRGFDIASSHVITTERSARTQAQAIVNMFAAWYADVGLVGCSSHSGRRTFITNAARKISSVGGSLRDVQALAGHSSLAVTQRYIDGSEDARAKVVELV